MDVYGEREKKNTKTEKEEKNIRKALTNSFLRTENSLTKNEGESFPNCLYACVSIANADRHEELFVAVKRTHHLKARKKKYTQQSGQTSYNNKLCLPCEKNFFFKTRKNTNFLRFSQCTAYFVRSEEAPKRKKKKTPILSWVFFSITVKTNNFAIILNK